MRTKTHDTYENLHFYFAVFRTFYIPKAARLRHAEAGYRAVAGDTPGAMLAWVMASMFSSCPDGLDGERAVAAIGIRDARCQLDEAGWRRLPRADKLTWTACGDVDTGLYRDAGKHRCSMLGGVWVYPASVLMSGVRLDDTLHRSEASPTVTQHMG